MIKRNKKILFVGIGIILSLVIVGGILYSKNRYIMPVPENIKLGDNAGGINHCSDATWSCNESSGY